MNLFNHSIFLVFGLSAAFCATAFSQNSQPRESSATPGLNDTETIESQISKCTSPNITTGYDLDHFGFRCLEEQGLNYMILYMVFSQQYNPFGPPTFHIPDFYQAANSGIEDMSLKAAATPDGRLTSNTWTPYWDEPFPATNWTHGSSIIYFEGPPCDGEWDYDEDAQGPDMEPAKYKDIAACLRLLKHMVANTQRNDTNSVSWGEVVIVAKETPFREIRDEEVVVGSLMMQNAEGKDEYRRWTYQRNLEYVCRDGQPSATKVKPVAVN